MGGSVTDYSALAECRGPLLLSFELGENFLLWSAVSKKKKFGRRMFKGAIELGYSDIDNLAKWFDQFWNRAGNFNHHISLLISGPEMQQRSLTIPVVPKAEIPAVIKSQAKKVYPFDIGKGLLGWRIIDKAEWGGNLKYVVFTQALSENWNDWLESIFGKFIDNVSLITSSGQAFECMLSKTVDQFSDGDSFLIRLKMNIVETGFFHNGHLEFFREVPVESLTDGGTVAELRRSVGIEENTVTDPDLDQERIIREAQAIIDDAVDYYQGQFGQRDIRTVLISLPSQYSIGIVNPARFGAKTEIIDLCDKKRIANHCQLSGIATEFDEYSQWMSVFPNKRVSASLINLLPEKLQKKKKAARDFRYSLIGLALILVVIVSFSIPKAISINMLENGLNESWLFVTDAESDPVLSGLDEYRQKAVQLGEIVSIFKEEKKLGLSKPLRLLSHLSQKDIKLNLVDISRGTDGQAIVNVEGVVLGSSDRQEPSLYSYTMGLREHPAVRRLELKNKWTATQLGTKNVFFNIEMVVSQ